MSATFTMPKYKNTAISLVNPRETAIYFDHVIPVNLGNELLRLGDPADEDRNSKIFSRKLYSVLPPDFMRQEAFRSRLIAVNIATWHLLLKRLAASHGLRPNIKDLSDEEFAAIETNAADTFYAFVHDFGLCSCAVDAPDIQLADETSAAEDVVVTLMDLNLIDAEKASWEQIVEFRRSPEAMAKLRRFRLFAFTNYQGRDRAFVEDDILQRLADYSNTIAEWGFETRRGAFSALLSSKLLAGSITGSVISSLLGQPLPAIISAVGGVAIELGSIALGIEKRASELRKLVRENPVTYIRDAQDAFHNGA